MASMETQHSSAPLQPQEIQLLAAIVASMVPVFGRVQPGAAAPQTAGSQVEQDAAAALAQDITAHSLRKLAGYLDRNAERHRALEGCVPIVTRAARCFAARDFATSFAAVWQGYLAIAAARAEDPGLPALTEPPAGSSPQH